MSKTLKLKKQKAIQMFLLTVKNDIDKWKKKYSDEYLSQNYKDYYFHVHLGKGRLTLNTYSRGDDLVLTHYNNIFKISNWKVKAAVKKLKRHFKQIEIDEKVKNEINFIDRSLTGFNEIFLKEVRKEKLEKLK